MHAMLRLLGAFEFRLDDCVVSISGGSQRLVALLALRRGLLPRTQVAGMLWPDVAAERAHANLRASIWRLPLESRPILALPPQHIGLAASVAVDVPTAISLARRLLDRSKQCDQDDLNLSAHSQLAEELLPGCGDDDWVLLERERFHQLRIHALEALCDRLARAGRYGEAVDAGLAAVCAEPLRESAHGTLISAHIAEGNLCEARRQYEICRRLLNDELGIEPSENLRRLVRNSWS
jgi:DNA-binding SARP family transcriptional activator